MLLRLTLAVLLAGGCARPLDCDSNPEPGVTRGALSGVNGSTLRGGWDHNGSTLRGGWDRNGQTLTGHSFSSLRLLQPQADLTLQGTRLMAQTGEIAPGARFVALQPDGTSVTLTVVGAELERGVTLYQLELEGRNVCPSTGRGLFMAGTWDESGTYRSTAEVTWSCTDGAIAKCARMGYSGELHQACTRMVRADYCGTGVSFTRDGTPIDAYDSSGLLVPSGEASFSFEAAFGPNGALCVNHPRYLAHNEAGDIVAPSCWSALPRCESWEQAQQFGASVGVSSLQLSRTYCD